MRASGTDADETSETAVPQGVLLQYKASSGIWYVVADDLALSQLDLRYVPQVNGVTKLDNTAAIQLPKWLAACSRVADSTGNGKVVLIGEREHRDRIFSHPAFLFVITLFLCWSLLSATWAEHPGAAVVAFTRYLPNAMLFLIVFVGTVATLKLMNRKAVDVG